MALNILTAGADIFSLAVTIGDLTRKEDAQAQSIIQLGIGGSSSNDPSSDLGGNVPHIALWDKDGKRIGQHSPSSHDRMKSNTENTIVIKNYQSQDPDQVQPEYVMLSMNDNDAICLAYVFATGNSAQWSWFGDLGHRCGADWYNSDYIVGDGTYTPKCVWLDHDHSYNLRFNGLSLHMPDFAADEQGKVEEYQDNLDTLCKSTPRMKFWNDVLPDDEIPIHNWQYHEDGSDTVPASGIDPAIDPASTLFQVISDRRPRPRRRDRNSTKRTSTNNNNTNTTATNATTANPSPGHLVVSGHQGHSAQELCNSKTSRGPDFVSMVERLYCDMDVKLTWPLCDTANNTTACFDLTTQTRRVRAAGVRVRNAMSGRRRGDEGDIFAAKSYHSVEKWGGATLPGGVP